MQKYLKLNEALQFKIPSYLPRYHLDYENVLHQKSIYYAVVCIFTQHAPGWKNDIPTFVIILLSLNTLHSAILHLHIVDLYLYL